MPGLELKKNNDTFVLEPLGNVTVNGASVGKWMTNAANKIVVTKSDNSTVTFDVNWAFNSDNQLVVSSGTKEFNFHSVAANVPRYETLNAVLLVKPNKNESFVFELRGDWALTETHDLSITINGKKSVLDGFIQDPRSRFMFHFVNKKNLLQGSVLGFVGAWTESVDASGKPRLKFTYKRDGQADGEFTLPKGVVVERGSNQLLYEYDKQGRKARIQFVGTLMVNNDFTITYALDRQTSDKNTDEQVAATTFVFGAVFKKKNFSGDLELALKKEDGTAGSTTLTIGGTFTAVLGGSAKVKAGFSFQQKRAGNVSTTTFGFAGELETKSGNKVQWTFATSNAATRTIDLAVNAEIRLGEKASLDERLNLKLVNGEVRGITFLLGVNF